MKIKSEVCQKKIFCTIANICLSVFSSLSLLHPSVLLLSFSATSLFLCHPYIFLFLSLSFHLISRTSVCPPTLLLCHPSLSFLYLSPFCLSLSPSPPHSLIHTLSPFLPPHSFIPLSPFLLPTLLFASLSPFLLPTLLFTLSPFYLISPSISLSHPHSLIQPLSLSLSPPQFYLSLLLFFSPIFTDVRSFLYFQFAISFFYLAMCSKTFM
jgi:hypothetical protein